MVIVHTAKPADECARQRRFEREGVRCSIISPPLNHLVGHEICCRTWCCHLIAELARLPVSTSALAGAANAIAAGGIPETLVAVMAEPALHMIRHRLATNRTPD
jgi:hypothetical protein